MSGQVVVFTANDRPHYMARTLDLWSRVRGIGDCRLIFRCEPGCPEMAALCGTASDFAGEVTVIVNEERHGVLRNPHTALTTGFAFGDFVILAEDDLTPADDTLELLAWCRDKYAGDPQVIAASASRIDEYPGGPSGVMRHDRFHCWIWGTWRDRWENLLSPDWQFDYALGGWDWRINNYWLGELGYRDDVDVKDAVELGRLTNVVYRTQKEFHDLQMIDYDHEIGKREPWQKKDGIGPDMNKEIAECPVLAYHTRENRLSVIGGQYLVLDVGITN